MNSPARSIGRVLNDTWRLDSKLGSGGLATVYRAVHVRTGVEAAVKVLHPSHAHNDAVRARFAREGQASNHIGHPGVVRVIGDGIDGDAVYLVMELIRGKSLSDIWKEHDRKLDVAFMAPVVSDLLAILEAAHSSGIVHRDIKPDNILITEDGQTKVVDFGIARIHALAGESTKTATGVTLGTPAFMAPEQAMSRWADVDHRTDLFAVAATAWTMITGSLVHRGATVPELLVSAGTRQVAPIATVLPTIAPAVGDVLDKALQFHRDARFANAAEMRRAWSDAFEAKSRPAVRTISMAASQPAESLRPSPGQHSFTPTVAHESGAHPVRQPPQIGIPAPPAHLLQTPAPTVQPAAERRAMSRRSILALGALGIVPAGIGGYFIARAAMPETSKKSKKASAKSSAAPAVAAQAQQSPATTDGRAKECPALNDLQAFANHVTQVLQPGFLVYTIGIQVGVSGMASVITQGKLKSFFYGSWECRLDSTGDMPLVNGIAGFKLESLPWDAFRATVAGAPARFQKDTGLVGKVEYLSATRSMNRTIMSIRVVSAKRAEQYNFDEAMKPL